MDYYFSWKDFYLIDQVWIDLEGHKNLLSLSTDVSLPTDTWKIKVTQDYNIIIPFIFYICQNRFQII